MALARAHTWNVGDLLKSADLNGEFNNILNNPITLISPTTGVINFAGLAHVGLNPSAITATSAASAGQALIYNGVSTNVVFGAPTVTGSGVTVVVGTTGQVLAITSSNSPAAFQVIPIDGGLSTAAPTIGMTYYISTGGTLLLGRTIGTSGQVYTVSTSGVPVWATPSASAGGSASAFSSQAVWQDEFDNTIIGDTANLSSEIQTLANVWYGLTVQGAAAVWTQLSTNANGIIRLTMTGANSFGLVNAKSSNAPRNFIASTLNPGFTINLITSLSTGFRVGFSTAAALSSDPSNGLYFRTSALGSTWQAVARTGGAETVINTTAVASSAWQVLNMVVTGTAGLVTVKTNGVTAGTFTSSAIATGVLYGFSFGTSATATVVLDGYQITQDRSTASYA